MEALRAHPKAAMEVFPYWVQYEKRHNLEAYQALVEIYKGIQQRLGYSMLSAKAYADKVDVYEALLRMADEEDPKERLALYKAALAHMHEDAMAAFPRWLDLETDPKVKKFLEKHKQEMGSA